MKTELSDAVKLIEKNIKRMETEYINTCMASGRVLAEDIYAINDYPPFSRSPYDGYALRAEDKEFGDEFEVVGVSFAGTPFLGKVEKMQSVKIMTGGVIPYGADCVVPWESTDRGEKTVKIYADPNPFENYIRQGEDFEKGELILRKDTKIFAAEAALAAAGGVSEIKVYRRLRAAVISTGDEVTKLGEVLKHGKIYDTNIIYISCRLKELGVETVYLKSVPDDECFMADVFLKALNEADIVFTTGGVSVGQKDFVPSVLEKIGADIVFKGVNIKPGMPTVFSIGENGVPILSLSGNPFAAAVAFELLGRIAMAALSGDNSILPDRSEAVLKNGYYKKSGMDRYIKAYENGGIVSISDSQGNGSIRSMSGSNCLVHINAGTEEILAGEKVEIIYV